MRRWGLQGAWMGCREVRCLEPITDRFLSFFMGAKLTCPSRVPHASHASQGANSSPHMHFGLPRARPRPTCPAPCNTLRHARLLPYMPFSASAARAISFGSATWASSASSP